MDIDDLRKKIHDRWDWSAKNFPNLKEDGVMAKARHLQLHFSAGVGKLAHYVETYEHGRGPDQHNLRPLVREVCASLLMNTLEFANVFDIKTEDLVDTIERIQLRQLDRNRTAA